MFCFVFTLVGETKNRQLPLTVTLHALVDEAVQQGATVVAEGGAPVGVDLELVLCSGVLVDQRKHERYILKN